MTAGHPTPQAYRESSAHALGAALPDLADGIAAQLHDLSRHPAASRAEAVLRSVHGLSHHLNRLRTALEREGRGHDR